MLSVDDLMIVLDRLVKMLRLYAGEAGIREVREGKGEFQVYIELASNPSGVSTVKILIKKDCSKIWVYTGRVSLDLKVKRFLLRELACLNGGRGR
ncbi:hypothetical protein [Desulfurococcus mucosus]|uniref:Uncharacterized protein n=1 Tax=Desulfurococcus mucosus (strain ATCC 35584 / DSM 2162 / JCM 9187 / O7/1) TaxID=765177 RepID=E8R9B7_DESM0|nr:hypothetical protein [Desulfurococcus mucosus]ADV65093.1 hypothetical protein Desmu_0789 [Desulfurococcus mucosus DSM 2162]